MKGSESLLATAKTAGVQVCFANPGTTEIPLVEAFDQVDGVRAVLALSEGVVTGAADGHARMTGVPAMTLLHLGPGLANGLANLHNARRARTPVLNVIGEHATWHQPADAPLASDIELLARPVSGWVGRTSSAAAAATEFVEAHQAALRHRLPATLIAAADHMWSQGGEPADVPAAPARPAVADQRIAEIAKLLNAGRGRSALLLGGHTLTADGIRTAARIAARVGGEVFVERSPARIERGPGVPPVRSVPYFPEDVMRVFDGFSHLVLIGARTPVAFFGYRGMPSYPLPNRLEVHELADANQDAVEALRTLAEVTGSAAVELPRAERPQGPTPKGPLSAASIAAAIVLTQPDQAIVVNEGVSSGAAYPAIAAAAPPHCELTNTGGAIGMGMPVATGAAVACPDRPVINLQADGSAAYTVQALWTQAREGLDVTTVICANSRYQILEAELRRAGIEQPGEAAANLTSLGSPTVDWTAVARGFGVPANRVTTGEELVEALRRAHAEPGPHLIEAILGTPTKQRVKGALEPN
ncbi:acetolactate synthase I/II/III large subunit [Saccharopolyspora subtropica]|uniref:Acetolactate synthase I/II/III large subunit n=1 Tax=Saccharopolyspora thermophila TaxID=89367 RepID=A0A917JXK8_9PSEU|nr:acetolactate synthase large subunit [Saccharopolyspora subtropica]GGI89095.1 acetolactate synthase I/II/III large subunit [Saccharopolyspora subtropica]